MLMYVTAIFAWFAFVLLGVAVVVLLEPVWNREASLARSRAVGCGPCRARERRGAP
jgi:hypothetical protein